MGYEGHVVPQIDANQDIPYEFADFIVGENPDWMSPNGAGAFHLYIDNKWTPENNQNTKVLLSRFKKRAKSDGSISDEDVKLAENWVGKFGERHGASQLFYFHG